MAQTVHFPVACHQRARPIDAHVGLQGFVREGSAWP
jgi:hypothetical protein